MSATNVGDRVTVTAVNFRTLAQIERCMKSFLEFYPSIPFILIDNGSGDKSAEYVVRVGRQHKNVRLILNPKNIAHGPALCQAVEECETRFLFTLDSDTSTHKGGFLEKMLALFDADPLLFALGQFFWVNKRGMRCLRPELGHEGLDPYVHPSRMLIDLDKYRQVRPFHYHGAPCLDPMWDAFERGWHITAFPIGDYVKHHFAGTRGKYPGQPWFVPS